MFGIPDMLESAGLVSVPVRLDEERVAYLVMPGIITQREANKIARIASAYGGQQEDRDE
jgi:hypothetical protein